MIRWFGPLSACGIMLLGFAAASRAKDAQDLADGLHGLAILLTIATGMCSAVWWHQSAGLPDLPNRSEQQGVADQHDANVLNAAAATATGLALIGGVYTSLSWSSAEGLLAATAFLLLLAMSGSEIWLATGLSLRHGLRPRSALAVAVVVLASLIFVARRLIR